MKKNLNFFKFSLLNLVRKPMWFVGHMMSIFSLNLVEKQNRCVGHAVSGNATSVFLAKLSGKCTNRSTKILELGDSVRKAFHALENDTSLSVFIVASSVDRSAQRSHLPFSSQVAPRRSHGEAARPSTRTGVTERADGRVQLF